MRHGRVYLFVLMCCLFPLAAYAENKKIVIACAELMSIEIKQPPPGAAFFGEECGDKCFYIEFIMSERAAKQFHTTYNSHKHATRELYIDTHLVGTAEPFYHDIPYAQKIGTVKIHQTLESAIKEAQEACPNIVIKVPDIVRH